MIIVKLQGGLGNQMFQYAAGRRLAHVLHDTLMLDMTGFAAYPARVYALHCFNINEDFSSVAERNKFFTKRNSISRFFARTPCSVVREHPAPSFVAQLLTATGNVYLDGYWQSERYFEDISTVVRKELTLTAELNAFYADCLSQIANVNAVSIHIRRGDYVTDEAARRLLGTCPLEYYERAVEYIAAVQAEPVFFIFSDDLQWAKDNVKLAYPANFVDALNDADDCQELWVMSRCKHHIIANSSYSWWAAWLNPSPDKVVCAPKTWFAGMPFQSDIIIPPQWHAMG